jgi:hypothetical protein
MLDKRFLPLIAGLVAVLIFSSSAFAQEGWIWFDQEQARQKQSPKATPGHAPRHDLTGMWAGGSGLFAGPTPDGRPEHALPFTPYGLKLFKSHKALEGFDAVDPGQENDPRELCDPLGMPHVNHYQVRQTQIFQDNVKVVILYQFDNRWRIIWTDGRELPKVVDGGVQIGKEVREQRFYGYSVGKWVDDTTLVAQTLGTMPEDRVWLDAAGCPISEQVKTTETFHRVDHDTLRMSETIDDPKIYTKPWQAMDVPLKLMDPRTDVMEFYCSPVERARYNELTVGPDAAQSKAPAK